MTPLGSDGHRAIIEQVIAHYRDDERILAIGVFGSVGAGTWHELSDVDLDIVTSDGAVISPGDEVAALFGPRAAIILARGDSADIVLDSLDEVSIRWHPLTATSPNIRSTVRVVHGGLTQAEVVAAGEVNQGQRGLAAEQHLADAFVRDAIGAAKYLARGKRWEAVAAVERMRRALVELRGKRDNLRLDPADPAGALTAVLAEAQADCDLGSTRLGLLDRMGLGLVCGLATAAAAVVAACTVCSCAAAPAPAPASSASPAARGTAAPASSFATPLEATLAWFAAVNAKDKSAAVAHFVPADASMMNWGNGDTSTWSTFTRLRCKPLNAAAATATVYCSFDESQSPSEGNPDTFWTVDLTRQTDGRWLIDNYGQG